MIEAIAVVLLLATVATWLRLAMPQLVTTWLRLARELDPSTATSHAVLFAPATRGHS